MFHHKALTHFRVKKSALIMKNGPRGAAMRIQLKSAID